MIPVRCFTCNKVIASKWNSWKELIKTHSHADALDKLGLTRYCCRRMILGHVEIDEELMDLTN